MQWPGSCSAASAVSSRVATARGLLGVHALARGSIQREPSLTLLAVGRPFAPSSEATAPRSEVRPLFSTSSRSLPESWETSPLLMSAQRGNDSLHSRAGTSSEAVARCDRWGAHLKLVRQFLAARVGGASVLVGLAGEAAYDTWGTAVRVTRAM